MTENSSDPKDPGTSLMRLIGGTELPSVLTDLGEAALDTIQSDEVLREIPVLRTILGLRQLGTGIREALYTKKLALFLSPLVEVPEQERRALIARITAGSESERDAGERILLILERLDSFEKSRLVGRAFVAFAKGNFDRTTLDRILYSLDRVLLADLRELPGYLKDKRIPQRSLYGLVNAGLVRIPDGLLTSRHYPDDDVCRAIIDHVLPVDFVG